MALTDTLPVTLTREQAMTILMVHGHAVRVVDDVLLASVEWSIVGGDGGVLTSGVDWEAVPLTTSDLYTWLGY